MGKTTPFGTRKGITPVVAIILLLMLVIVAVGGMWGWISGIMEEGQSSAESELRSGMEFSATSCLLDGSSNDKVTFLLKNNGQEPITLTDATLEVRRAGDLIESITISSTPLTDDTLTTQGSDRQWDAGETATAPSGSEIDLGSDGLFTAGQYYDVTIETRDGSSSATMRCQAE